jgi:hypothetical protein
MAQVERRQARIHHIRSQQFSDTLDDDIDDNVASSPDIQYVIGQSQNNPLDIVVFMQRHDGDPALHVSTCNVTQKYVSSMSAHRNLFLNSGNICYHGLDR